MNLMVIVLVLVLAVAVAVAILAVLMKIQGWLLTWAFRGIVLIAAAIAVYIIFFT